MRLCDEVEDILFELKRRGWNTDAPIDYIESRSEITASTSLYSKLEGEYRVELKMGRGAGVYINWSYLPSSNSSPIPCVCIKSIEADIIAIEQLGTLFGRLVWLCNAI